jgi:N-acetylmuramoyl-L-alanine amidase
MDRRWKGAVAALMGALALTIPVWGAEVTVNGQTLPADQAWVADGTSYITLRAYAALTQGQLSWDGRSAQLEGNGLSLTATPGQLYVTANERPLFVRDGVMVVDGKLVLPLRVMAQATGAQLRWDSAAATASLTTAGAQPATASYQEEDLYWLSRVISAESGGEPLLGQIAVGNVVLNRVKSSQFPNTVRGVVFDTQDGVQFEPVSNGTIYNTPTESAVLAAKLCLEGAEVVGDSLYFYAPALSAGAWIVRNCTYYTTIGCHRFYL